MVHQPVIDELHQLCFFFLFTNEKQRNFLMLMFYFISFYASTILFNCSCDVIEVICLNTCVGLGSTLPQKPIDVIENYFDTH